MLPFCLWCDLFSPESYVCLCNTYDLLSIKWYRRSIRVMEYSMLQNDMREINATKPQDLIICSVKVLSPNYCLYSWQNFHGPEFVKMASEPCVALSVPSSIMVRMKICATKFTDATETKLQYNPLFALSFSTRNEEGWRKCRGRWASCC